MKTIKVIQGIGECRNEKVRELRALKDHRIIHHVKGVTNDNVFKDALHKLKNREDISTIVISTNAISRKFRTHMYSLTKSIAKNIDLDVNVELVFILKPLADLKPNTSLDAANEYIYQSYAKLAPPRLNVDCDSVTVCKDYDWFDVSNIEKWKTVEDVIENSFSSFKEEILPIKDLIHNAPPYHEGYVVDHINEVANHDVCKASLNMRLVALFHDLGKSVTRQQVGPAKPFRSHENIGALYMLSLISQLEDGFNDRNMAMVEMIFQHTNAHTGITVKNGAKNKLNRLLLPLELFASIDGLMEQSNDN